MEINLVCGTNFHLIENFISELHELYPKDLDIALAKNTIFLLKKDKSFLSNEW